MAAGRGSGSSRGVAAGGGVGAGRGSGSSREWQQVGGVKG